LLSLRLLRKERKMSKKKPRIRGLYEIFMLQLLVFFVRFSFFKRRWRAASSKFTDLALYPLLVFFARLFARTTVVSKGGRGRCLCPYRSPCWFSLTGFLFFNLRGNAGRKTYIQRAGDYSPIGFLCQAFFFPKESGKKGEVFFKRPLILWAFPPQDAPWRTA